MKRISATGLLTLVAMLVLGVFYAGSASAGGGPNSVFLFTGPLPGLLLILSDNPQVFEAEAGSNNPIECKELKAVGRINTATTKGMTAKSLISGGIYSGCTLPNAGGIEAEVSQGAEIELSAAGTATIVGKPIVITIPAAGCSLKISPGPQNTGLRLILYLNLPSDILAHVEITKLLSLSSGGACGAPEQPNGTYRGLLLISVDGGTIRWDP